MASKWIKSATKGSHGQFRAKAEKAGKSTREFAKEHDSDSGLLGKQARLAENLMAANGANKSRRETLYDHPKSKR